MLSLPIQLLYSFIFTIPPLITKLITCQCYTVSFSLTLWCILVLLCSHTAPVTSKICVYSIQDIATLFNMIIILLMMFNTYVFQVGLVSLLLERFRALLISSALYLTLSICFHSWVLVSFCTQTQTPVCQLCANTFI